jgi:hypothetical protein
MRRLLVLVMLFSSVGSAYAVSVCKDGSCNETTTGAALTDPAYRGQDVTVGPGTYFESNLKVNPSGPDITLISETPNNPGATIIAATGTENTVISRMSEGRRSLHKSRKESPRLAYTG